MAREAAEEQEMIGSDEGKVKSGIEYDYRAPIKWRASRR